MIRENTTRTLSFDSMDSEQYTIRGVTGIDVMLPIAGPGSRSYAFVIDWHIRLLVAVAWLLVALFFETGAIRYAANISEMTRFFIFLPAAIIYFLYHPIIELLLRGQSPGKRMAGVRVVTLDGATPGVAAVLIRNVFRLIDSLPAFYLVGLLVTFFSAQRVRIGDMAAGTLLVMEERISSRYFERAGATSVDSPADFAALDLIEQLLERWPALETANRDAIARSLLKKVDPGAADVGAMTDELLHARLIALIGARPSA
jgi:uncharacterized RDD family membrane protein YckC